jgi:hypothetical protein
MKKDDLLKILQDDEHGLLAVKSKVPDAITADERLLVTFKEIEDFVKTNGRPPRADASDVHEFKLCSRLEAIKSSPAKSNALRAVDTLGLIGVPVNSVAGVLGDDDMGLLDDGNDSIFTLRHVPATMQMPETIAQRKPCKDFEKFDALFVTCHAELGTGVREMRPFTGEQQIQPGHFFILHGVMVYVAEVGEKEMRNKKVNARLRCIFENGTESNMLLRSLATELYKDTTGRRILNHADKAFEELSGITTDDKETGFIYVLRSLSENPDIKGINHLYKIGYSSVSVPDRIKNAKREPTYLMAPVKIISTYKCFNLNPQKFELLLHTFFGSNCLEVAVTDEAGRSHKPREWFIAPLPAIELAVQLVINGEIIHYRYDEVSEDVVERV